MFLVRISHPCQLNNGEHRTLSTEWWCWIGDFRRTEVISGAAVEARFLGSGSNLLVVVTAATTATADAL